MATTSLSLLERARRDGDSDAWRRLADLYTPLLNRWLSRYALQPSDADDLVQEVLLTLAKELPHFDHGGRRGAFRAWLRGIMVNRLRESWRRRRLRPQGRGDSDFLRQLQELQDPHSQLSRVWEQEHDQYLLDRLLEVIAARFQPATMEAFRRVAIEGQPAEDAASDLGMSVNAVVIAKCRVLKELRREAGGLLDV